MEGWASEVGGAARDGMGGGFAGDGLCGVLVGVVWLWRGIGKRLLETRVTLCLECERMRITLNALDPKKN